MSQDKEREALIEAELGLFAAWQMLEAICETDFSLDRKKIADSTYARLQTVRAALATQQAVKGEPISTGKLRDMFLALRADPRSAQFTDPEHWFAAGSAMTEAHHGLHSRGEGEKA